MVLYGRHISVSVAGLVITEPRIRAVVERQADATETTGSVAIYNLAPSREGQIYERAEAIQIQAGYPLPSPPYSRGRYNGCAARAKTWRT